MTDLFYFAYGSNMLPARLMARVPSARVYAMARLNSYTLSFCKSGDDGSGKCNLLQSDSREDHAYGVIYRMAANEKSALDKLEGPLYDVVELELSVLDRPHAAFAYVAGVDHMDERLQPYAWYKNFVVEGALAHGLPADYVEYLNSVETIDDPDKQRSELNALILTERLR